VEVHSFVIPAYGESPYLDNCIQGLLGQSVKSEVIITTSTPSPFLGDLAVKYCLPYFVNPQTKAGIASDWNFALNQATTPLVTIAHQDDDYLPQFVELTVAKLKDNSRQQSLIAFTDYTELIDDQHRTGNLNSFVKKSLLLPFLLKNKISNRLLKHAVLSLGDPICCPSVTINKEALPDFQFSEDYTCVLDWEAWYQLAQQKGAFIYINKKLVKHRIHDGSETTNQLNTGLRQAEELQMFNKIWGKTFALVIAAFYKLGHRNNRI